MVEKLILKDGKDINEYILEPILSKNECYIGAYPINIKYSIEPIDGHFLISTDQRGDDFSYYKIKGIAHSFEDLSYKAYKCTVDVGGEYSIHLNCSFEDHTSIAKKCVEFNKKISSYNNINPKDELTPNLNRI